MKKTLFNYIVKEMFLYFFICFLFFFLIFFVNQILLIAEDILSKKAPVKQVLLLILYSLPMIIATAAPFATLVGILMGTGRLVSDREILSMNALGVSKIYIMLPVILVGIIISIFSFVTNDILLPAGTIRYHKLYRTILTSTPALELESNSIKRIENNVIVTGRILDQKMDNILVIDSMSDSKKRIITSTNVEINMAENPAVLLTLDMNDASIFTLHTNKKNDFDLIEALHISYHIFIKNIFSHGTSHISPREMSSRDLSREIKIKSKDKEKFTLNLYKMEFHKKFSIPFGALFFTFLAFPLGLFVTINGQGVGFIFGLIISVIYWAMLIGGQTLCIKFNLNGPLMMWLPNIVIFIIGIIISGKQILK